MVVFFPSYHYSEEVLSRWREYGLLDQISRYKRVFQEPRSSSTLDRILRSYAATINQQGSSGAILFSVVGGKMSEGINFSDQLGRCVVLVGMPYPNINSPELREKLTFLERTFGVSQHDQLEKVCMKAVNQSIGRAIRHRGDFACVLLLDQRYQRAGIGALFPNWIRCVLRVENHFPDAKQAVKHFFQVVNPTKSTI